MKTPIESLANLGSEGTTKALPDQRKHVRFGVDLSAKASVLGTQEDCEAQIVDMSQQGLRLNVPISFPIGEIIRVESGDEVFVAVVCHSAEREDGQFTIGVRMMHSIKKIHLESLVNEWGAG